MNLWTFIAGAVGALLPFIVKVLNVLIKTPEEKREEALKKLPDQLKEITDAIKQSEVKGDPSAINRIINRG